MKINFAKFNFIIITAFIMIMVGGFKAKAATYESIFEYELKSEEVVITKYIGSDKVMDFLFSSLDNRILPTYISIPVKW